MRRNKPAIVLCLFLLVPAVALAQGAVEVTDDLGRQVVLSHSARRIVSLAPHNTENLFSAGAGQWLVATVEHSDFPPAARDIPRIGNYRQINIESLLALKPDLVVVWASGNPPELLEKLEQLGLTLFYSEPKTFPQVVDNIRKLSILGGTEKQSTPPLKRLLADYSALKQKYAGRKRLSVFYQLWNEPLMTLNGGHLVSNAIEICGGHNVFADLPMIAPRVNVESVLVKNPDVILIAGQGINRQPEPGRWRRWPSLGAVQNNHIFSVNSDLLHRQTARFLQGMKQVCGLLDQARSPQFPDSGESRNSGTTIGISK